MTKQSKNTNSQTEITSMNKYASIMEDIEMTVCFYDRSIAHAGEDQLTDSVIRVIYQQLLGWAQSIKSLRLALRNLPRLPSKSLTCLRDRIAEDLLEPPFGGAFSPGEIVSALRLLIHSLDLWTKQRPGDRGYLVSVRERYDDILSTFTWEAVPVPKNPPSLSQMQAMLSSEHSLCSL